MPSRVTSSPSMPEILAPAPFHSEGDFSPW
jgi:hypothetical protein